MNQALLLNLCIIGAVIVGMIVLQNPLSLFALLLLKEMPYGLLVEENEPEQAEGIGFIR